MKFISIILLTLVCGFLVASNGIPEEKKDDYFLAIRREPTFKERVESTFRGHASNMFKIARCESGFDVNNPTTIEYARRNVNWNDAKITGRPSIGIWQVNVPYDPKWFDPVTNLKEAKRRFDGQGYPAWKNCARGLGLL